MVAVTTGSLCGFETQVGAADVAAVQFVVVGQAGELRRVTELRDRFIHPGHVLGQGLDAIDDEGEVVAAVGLGLREVRDRAMAGDDDCGLQPLQSLEGL